MTTEQAIELLMSVKWNANIDEQEDKALSMAIEALSAQTRIMTCSKCKHKIKCFSQIAVTNKYQTTTIFYDIDFCSRCENEDNG